MPSGLANLNIFGSTIQDNEASAASPIGVANRGGGGLYFESMAAVAIDNSSFLNNGTAENGGGLAAHLDAAVVRESLTITDSKFDGNEARGTGDDDGGGGINVFFFLGRFDLLNTTVSNNRAFDDATGVGKDGGGVWLCSKDDGIFNSVNSTISGNSASNGVGGGIWMGVQQPFDTMVTSMDHVTITDNHSPVAGGLFSEDEPGDANLDNKVDGADYMIWQANDGAIETLFGDADFNGDGVVDGNDFLLWQQNTGSNLEALWILADLDGDYDVDNDDLMIMIANVGGTGHTWAEGDLNGDGLIDVNDYWLWLGQDGLDIDVVA